MCIRDRSKTAALRSTWMARVHSRNLLQSGVVLAHLFRPENFLNALRQEAARACNVSMDALALVTSTSPSSLDRYMCATLEGLLLQGGALLDGKLIDVQSHSALVTQIQAIGVAWVPEAEADSLLKSFGTVARIPMYTSPSREELVSEITLPCSGDPSVWAVAGVTIILANE
eukprot:TRINITY_DN62132_c0_g1_i3.p1 TRINITY_DN62132_c0_g1~~TRINITY_DN62132_c0_g1_i3.p1  ORF type:complete len:172 (+),score=38.11 TRINITY_DN62132_c0_g1_i3:113-628(+)